MFFYYKAGARIGDFVTLNIRVFCNLIFFSLGCKFVKLNDSACRVKSISTTIMPYNLSENIFFFWAQIMEEPRPHIRLDGV